MPKTSPDQLSGSPATVYKKKTLDEREKENRIQEPPG
jgi:hypothetical protein